MNTALRKCLDCGRLFAARDGEQQCRACSEDEQLVYRRIEDAIVTDELRTVPDIALALGVDAEVVRRVLADMPHLASLVENDALCPRCGIRPIAFGKEYCPHCLMDISASLREMAGAAARNMELLARQPETTASGVLDALRSKRRRTGHYRFDPAPPNIKGG